MMTARIHFLLLLIFLSSCSIANRDFNTILNAVVDAVDKSENQIRSLHRKEFGSDSNLVLDKEPLRNKQYLSRLVPLDIPDYHIEGISNSLSTHGLLLQNADTLNVEKELVLARRKSILLGSVDSCRHSSSCLEFSYPLIWTQAKGTYYLFVLNRWSNNERVLWYYLVFDKGEELELTRILYDKY